MQWRCREMIMETIKKKNKTHTTYSDAPFAVKVRTESNNLGTLKTIFVLFLIFSQAAILILSSLYFHALFGGYTTITLAISLFLCIYVLSSDFHGHAKAVWIIFLLVCFGFGWIFFLMSDKNILFARSRKKYQKIFKQNQNLQQQTDLSVLENDNIKSSCQYLYNSGKFVAHTDSKTTYYPSGTKLFDAILEELEKAKDFVFIEYYIVANGILLNKFLDILKEKVKQGVDVRIIYDDMGSHGTLKRRTKKEIANAGIKIQDFNRMVPIFNVALNLRDHRKIVVIDGKVCFTGGANLADEYTNEKRMHGYWKDAGIKVEGRATDNFTIAFLNQWQFLTKQQTEIQPFLNKSQKLEGDGVVVPFVTGPHYKNSIAQNIYANEIANAKEKLFIMTPYFIPDETITNLLKLKAKAGVDVRIILPEVPDKKFVYDASRNYAEKLMDSGVRVFTFTHSFVHSKIVLTENSAIVGSINMDLRSFNQQFESAVLTNNKSVMKDVSADFEKTILYCQEVTDKNKKRKKLTYRIWAGLLHLISTFM